MPFRKLSARVGVGASLLVAFGSAAHAVERHPPIVVELFTSQGCSSCPPANANLITLSQRPDILALSFGVTYWDRLGWKDIFARPDYTARQEAYEGRLDRSGPFTPQIVVNGRIDTVGASLADVEQLVAAAKGGNSPALRLDGRAVTVGAGTPPAGGADIWLVRYDPKIVEVPVRRGENTGRTLPHTHVVHDLSRLGRWTGMSLTLPYMPSTDGWRTAVLVQTGDGGPILSATTD